MYSLVPLNTFVLCSQSLELLILQNRNCTNWTAAVHSQFPSPWQLSVSMILTALKLLHISGITQYLSFRDWIIAHYLQVLFMLWPVSEFLSILRLNIPWFVSYLVYPSLSVCIHVTFICWILWVKLLWTWTYILSLRPYFQFSDLTSSRSGGAGILFSIAVISVYVPTNRK